MFVTKCDLCKKEIKEQPINVRFRNYETAEFCEKCGLPILKFLKKHAFIKSLNRAERDIKLGKIRKIKSLKDLK